MSNEFSHLQQLCAAAYRMENFNPTDKQAAVKALLEYRTHVRDAAFDIFQFVFTSELQVGPHVQYEVAHIVREAIVSRWSVMDLPSRQRAFQLLTSAIFAWRPGQLEIYVERQFWVTMAVLLKRAMMSGQEDAAFMEMVLTELEKAAGDRSDPRFRMAIEQLLEILNEMTSMDHIRYRSFVPRLDFFKAKKRFENEHLTRIFLIILNFIRSHLSESGAGLESQGGALGSGVRALEVIFSWIFLPEKIEGTNFAAFQRRITFIQGQFRPGPNWRQVLTDDNILTFFFMAFLKCRSDGNFEASTAMAGCLSQLVTAQDNALRSAKLSEEYRLKILSWSVELMDQVMQHPNVDGDFEALVNYLHQLVQVIHGSEILGSAPASSAEASADSARLVSLVERFLRHLVAFLCHAMRRAALEVVEETLTRPYEYIEDRAMMAFHHALTQGAIQLRGAAEATRVSPEALTRLRKMAQEVFEVFMQSRLCVPFGFRNMAQDGSHKASLEYDRQEFDDECDEEDRELYLTCLETAGLCVRFAPERCLPLLSGQLLQHRRELKEADPSNTLLLEDLHWLLMVGTHALVNFDGGSAEAGVPQELVEHSLLQVHRAGAQLDLPGLYQSLARSPEVLPSENVDDITLLTAVVLSYVRESNHVTSPQVMKDILWLVRSITRAYFFNSHVRYLTANGGGDEAGASQLLLVRLLLDPGPDGCPLLVHILDMLATQSVHVIHQWWQSHEVLLELTDMWNEIAQCKMLAPVLLICPKWRGVVNDLCELQPPFAHLNPSHIRDLVTAAVAVCVHVPAGHPELEIHFAKLASVVQRFSSLLTEATRRAHDTALRHQVTVGLYAVHGLVRAMPAGQHVHRLFGLLQPSLQRSIQVLFEAYAAFDEVIQPLLQTMRDLVQQASYILKKDEWAALLKMGLDLVRAFAANNTSSLSVLEEDKQASLCGNLCVLLDLLYHSLQNLFLLEEEAEEGSTLADFVFLGLTSVIPLIDYKALPTLPDLAERYFSLISNVASVFPLRVMSQPPEHLLVYLSSIEWAVFESISDRIANMGHEMAHFLAERLVKTAPNERAPFRAVLEFFEPLLHRLLLRLLDHDSALDVSLHGEASDSLYALICCCPTVFERTVREMAAQQPDQSDREALLCAFQKLTPEDWECGRLGRSVFRQRLEAFQTDVRRANLVR